MSSTSTQTTGSFTDQSKSILSTAKLQATGLPANTVQVWPGGATFQTIQAAINSITDAGPQVEYQVAIGPGVYNETVTMIDYVYLSGAGIGVTTVTAQGQANIVNGVVNSASNCGIGELSINATGGDWGTWAVGIKICGAGPFHISGVAIMSGDSNLQGNNVRGITNNTGSYTGNVVMGSCAIEAAAADGAGGISGIECFGNQVAGGFNMLIELTSITTVGSESFGVTTAVGASVTLEDSKITGVIYSLFNSDGASPITADQCTIVGPVSPGVVVNN